MIDRIQEAFAHQFSGNTWLDEQTKAKSLAKLNAVHKNVAYPEWMLNNTELDRLNGLEDEKLQAELLQEDNFMNIFLELSRNLARKELNDMTENQLEPRCSTARNRW